MENPQTRAEKVSWCAVHGALARDLKLEINCRPKVSELEKAGVPTEEYLETPSPPSKLITNYTNKLTRLAAPIMASICNNSFWSLLKPPVITWCRGLESYNSESSCLKIKPNKLNSTFLHLEFSFQRIIFIIDWHPQQLCRTLLHRHHWNFGAFSSASLLFSSYDYHTP